MRHSSLEIHHARLIWVDLGISSSNGEAIDILRNPSGLREVSVAVEVKGDRFHRAKDQKGAYRGLKVNKENHFVLIVSSMCDRQRMDTGAAFL